MKQQKSILVGVTASIAAYKACDLIRSLVKKDFNVRCAMSRDAGKFITELTLETLSGNKVVKDMFQSPPERNPSHISLSEADIIVVAPATADIIGKIAAGICDDILCCAICASKSPVVFAPAMNDNMFNNPIIQNKIEYLKSHGYHFVEPIEGDLACGRKGTGHIAPLDQILQRIETIL